jgi:1-acyl-sn-glycerol-3-phosphate acyltransferase
MSEGPSFRPAKPRAWVIRPVQTFLRFDLARRNRLHLEARDLDVLRALPQGAGVILAANHADETDFKACLELSRRSGRRFLFMMNREAFDEGYGVAGWWLQRLGGFSVERGGLHNEEAKRYAIDVVKRGREVLVIFPEGEIYYLNDLVQPFKSGAVDIAMQAVVEARRTRPAWTAYLVPLALKYRYREPIVPILERRTRSMERLLNIRMAGLSLQRRLARIMADLLRRQELAHHLRPAADRLTELGERVQEVRKAILSQAEARYAGATAKPPAQTMDRAWRLGSYLRDLLAGRGASGGEDREQARTDLASSESVARMGGWQPRYTDEDPSQERLAEMVLKLEREVYGTKRPRQGPGVAKLSPSAIWELSRKQCSGAVVRGGETPRYTGHDTGTFPKRLELRNVLVPRWRAAPSTQTPVASRITNRWHLMTASLGLGHNGPECQSSTPKAQCLGVTWTPSHQEFHIESLFLGIEVKINHCGIGDAIRQIKFYNSYIGVSNSYDISRWQHKTWVLATRYTISNYDAALLKREGIHHVLLGKGFDDWLARRQQSTEPATTSMEL